MLSARPCFTLFLYALTIWTHILRRFLACPEAWAVYFFKKIQNAATSSQCPSLVATFKLRQSVRSAWSAFSHHNFGLSSNCHFLGIHQNLHSSLCLQKFRSRRWVSAGGYLSGHRLCRTHKLGNSILGLGPPYLGCKAGPLAIGAQGNNCGGMPVCNSSILYKDIIAYSDSTSEKRNRYSTIYGSRWYEHCCL
jgi:hypothetical protein